MDKTIKSDELPEDVATWEEFQEEAKEKEVGLWKYGNAVIDSDDEQY